MINTFLNKNSYTPYPPHTSELKRKVLAASLTFWEFIREDNYNHPRYISQYQSETQVWSNMAILTFFREASLGWISLIILNTIFLASNPNQLYRLHWLIARSSLQAECKLKSSSCLYQPKLLRQDEWVAPLGISWKGT